MRSGAGRRLPSSGRCLASRLLAAWQPRAQPAPHAWGSRARCRPHLSGLAPVTTFLSCTMLGCLQPCRMRISRSDVTGTPSRETSKRTFLSATISPVLRSRALSARAAAAGAVDAPLAAPRARSCDRVAYTLRRMCLLRSCVSSHSCARSPRWAAAAARRPRPRPASQSDRHDLQHWLRGN
jgi:hypothetical protein